MGDCAFPGAWWRRNQTEYPRLGNANGNGLLSIAGAARARPGLREDFFIGGGRTTRAPDVARGGHTWARASARARAEAAPTAGATLRSLARSSAAERPYLTTTKPPPVTVSPPQCRITTPRAPPFT